jgi:hypothetical protein
MENANLYCVEFGEPDSIGWSSSSPKPAYVVAKTYSEAARKGSHWLKAKMMEEDKKQNENKNIGILTSDGSLNLEDGLQDQLIKVPPVKCIKLVSNEIIW